MHARWVCVAHSTILITSDTDYNSSTNGSSHHVPLNHCGTDRLSWRWMAQLPSRLLWPKPCLVQFPSSFHRVWDGRTGAIIGCYRLLRVLAPPPGKGSQPGSRWRHPWPAAAGAAFGAVRWQQWHVTPTVSRGPACCMMSSRCYSSWGAILQSRLPMHKNPGLSVARICTE